MLGLPSGRPLEPARTIILAMNCMAVEDTPSSSFGCSQSTIAEAHLMLRLVDALVHSMNQDLAHVSRGS